MGMGNGSPTTSLRNKSRWLIEMPVDKPVTDAFVVILSGDGGWRDLDRTIGRFLSSHGVPVVGFDCLNWFWKRRSPEEVGAELDRITALYCEEWNCPKVAFVGYSFGADVMPAAWKNMKPETKDRTALISLLAFAKTAAFEIKLGDFIGMSRPTEVPTLPDIPAMPPKLIQCFYGLEEKAETACLAFDAGQAEIISTPGGHHFDENYDALAEKIMKRLPPRS
ncbi:type IV secretion system protein VirJ [Acetobacteraceae bacterium H6797]|nr:type IV secretion system protein VirJ [Acetobacteraceae bacterium H6797]